MKRKRTLCAEGSLPLRQTSCLDCTKTYDELYDELIHVPFLIDVPGAEHHRINEPVGLDAIPPTVTTLLDTPAPSLWLGASLTPSVLTGESPVDDPIVSVTVRGDEVTAQPPHGHLQMATC